MNAYPQIGVGVIIAKGDAVLLVRRKTVHGAGSWSAPGGLDFGESLEQCAAREVMEETGIEITEIHFRAVTNDFFVPEDKHYITLWMEAEYLKGQPIVAAPYEISDFGWFSLNELPTPLFLPLQNLLAGRCYPAK